MQVANSEEDSANEATKLEGVSRSLAPGPPEREATFATKLPARATTTVGSAGLAN